MPFVSFLDENSGMGEIMMQLPESMRPFSEMVEVILRYIKKLTETPYKMTQADADAIYAAGWDESALSDAVLICGMFNMANRVVEGHGVNQNLSSEIFEQSAERLSEHGYLLP